MHVRATAYWVSAIKVTGYSLLLRMRGVRLRFTVNRMCGRLWHQIFITELKSNRILDYEERGRVAQNVYQDKHPVREILGVLLAWSGEKRMALWYEWPSLDFPMTAKGTGSEPPSSRLKTSHGCCQAGLFALSDCKIWRQNSPTRPWTLMPLPTLACCTQALRSYQLEGTHINYCYTSFLLRVSS